MAEGDDKAPEQQTNGVDLDQLRLPMLRKSILGGDGEPIKELKFREPTAGDIEVCGNPVLLDLVSGERPRVEFDGKAMTLMMARLAAVPVSSIRKMHTQDWNTAAWMLTRFFMPDL